MFEHLPDRIVFIRHPQCLHNIAPDDALKQGIKNRLSPLTELGEAQRDITASFLKETYQQFDLVYASLFTRTHTIPVAAGWNESLVQNRLLNERDMGVWHSHPRAEVREQFPHEEERLRSVGYYHYTPPAGESCRDVELRLAAFLGHAAHFAGAETMLISGHGILGLCFRRVLLGGTVDDWHSWDRLKNASVTEYQKTSDRTFALSLYNYVPWLGLLEEGGGVEA